MNIVKSVEYRETKLQFWRDIQRTAMRLHWQTFVVLRYYKIAVGTCPHFVVTTQGDTHRVRGINATVGRAPRHKQAGWRFQGFSSWRQPLLPEPAPYNWHRAVDSEDRLKMKYSTQALGLYTESAIPFRANVHQTRGTSCSSSYQGLRLIRTSPVRGVLCPGELHNNHPVACYDPPNVCMTGCLVHIYIYIPGM